MKSSDIKNAKAQNSLLESIVGFIDSANSGTLHTFLGVSVLRQFLAELLNTLIFPVIVCMSILNAALAWRRAFLEEGKSGSIVGAIVETIAALAITTAIIGSFIAATAFVMASPIIFSSIAIGKTIYHTCAAIYCKRQSQIYNHPTKTPVEIEKKRDEYFERSKKHAIGAVACLVASVVSVGVFLLGELVLTGVGAGLALFGIGLAIHKGYQSCKALCQETPATNGAAKTTNNHSQSIIATKLQLNLKEKNTNTCIATHRATNKIAAIIAPHRDNAPEKIKTYAFISNK